MESEPDVDKVTQWIRALGGEDEYERFSAIEALGKSGRASAVEPLIAALVNERDDMARVRMVEALGNLGDPRAVDALIAALQADPHRFLLSPERAAEALGKIGDPGAIEALLDALRNGYKDTREQAGRALAAGLHPRHGRGQPARERFRERLGLGGIEQLQRARQEDPDWEVCAAAKLALDEIESWDMDPDLRRRLGI